jgi:SAM-dependent methyltransferase
MAQTSQQPRELARLNVPIAQLRNPAEVADGSTETKTMRFDFDETFGEDYLYFYASYLTDELNDRDTTDIITFLGLEPGDSLLDAPCGHGRISNRLAGLGMHVTGVDASQLFLDVAASARSSAIFHYGDLRQLPVDGPFDAALSWFTSFGYFDDDDNRRVLAEYRRVLRPGGQLLIDIHNRDEFVRRFTPSPFSSTVQIGDDVLMDTTEFDTVGGRIETDRVIVRNGKVRRSHHSVRLPTISELGDWLHAVGFDNLRFTARDGKPPSIFRPRLIVIAW